VTVTQEDVAELAGVARRTVSNVVNDFPYVSADTRQRVQRAIETLGYQPNRAAQNLRTGRSGTIGVILPELDVGYFAEIGRLLVEEAEGRGYTVLIAQTLGHEDREIKVLDKFSSEQTDGLIFSPISVGASTLQAHARHIPLVLLGEHLVELERDHVAIDNVGATRAVVQHLIDTGHHSVAFVGRIQGGELNMANLRLRGYREALAENDIPFNPSLISGVNGYHRAQGHEAANALLDSGVAFDALFGATDLLAIGAMRALADAGVRVPSEVAVAGFDDLDEGRFSVPRLTTVSPNKARIASAALDLLIARIGGDTERGHHLGQTDYKVVLRESSASN